MTPRPAPVGLWLVIGNGSPIAVVLAVDAREAARGFRKSSTVRRIGDADAEFLATTPTRAVLVNGPEAAATDLEAAVMAAASTYSVTSAAVIGPARKRTPHASRARFAVMWVLRNTLDMRCEQVASAIGMDRTSVSYAMVKARGLYKTDPVFKAAVGAAHDAVTRRHDTFIRLERVGW